MMLLHLSPRIGHLMRRQKQFWFQNPIWKFIGMGSANTYHPIIYEADSHILLTTSKENYLQDASSILLYFGPWIAEAPSLSRRRLNSWIGKAFTIPWTYVLNLSIQNQDG